MCEFRETTQNQSFSHIASKQQIGDGAALVESLGLSIERASRGVSSASRFAQAGQPHPPRPTAAPLSCRPGRPRDAAPQRGPCRTAAGPSRLALRAPGSAGLWPAARASDSTTCEARSFFLLKSGVELTTHSVKLTKLTSIPKINRSISEAATFTFGRFATNFGP
jgi:hypothetical protein